jgi:hypothetical protein
MLIVIRVTSTWRLYEDVSTRQQLHWFLLLIIINSCFWSSSIAASFVYSNTAASDHHQQLELVFALSPEAVCNGACSTSCLPLGSPPPNINWFTATTRLESLLITSTRSSCAKLLFVFPRPSWRFIVTSSSFVALRRFSSSYRHDAKHNALFCISYSDGAGNFSLPPDAVNVPSTYTYYNIGARIFCEFEIRNFLRIFLESANIILYFALIEYHYVGTPINISNSN